MFSKLLFEDDLKSKKQITSSKQNHTQAQCLKIAKNSRSQYCERSELSLQCYQTDQFYRTKIDGKWDILGDFQTLCSSLVSCLQFFSQIVNVELIILLRNRFLSSRSSHTTWGFIFKSMSNLGHFDLDIDIFAHLMIARRTQVCLCYIV